MKFGVFNKVSFLLLTFLLAAPSLALAGKNSLPATESVKTLKVAVRAIKGVAEAKKSWQETVNFLNDNINGYRFELIPLVGFADMRNAIKTKSIDFVLTNPLAYAELNREYGITRILTLNKKQPNGVASTIFAAAIFTRADREDIQTLNDVKNKSVMGVHREAFGGWRMALREFLHKNIDLHQASSKVVFSANNTHQSVVYDVLQGKVDIGTVRTGILEQLAAQEKIKLASVKILNPHKDNLLALHSTQHYPEWPFSIMPHVSSDVANKVFRALLNIQQDSLAAIAGQYVNWGSPLDYSDVYALSNELSQKYNAYGIIWKEHYLVIILLLLFLIAIIFYTLYLFSINKKLSLSEETLNQHLDHLEEIVNQRTEELTREKEKSDKANHAKSEFLSNMSHELRTPLNAILGFSQLIQYHEAEGTTVSNNANEIVVAGNYLLSLINEILDLARIESGQNDLFLEKISFNSILQESLSIIMPLAKEKNITVNIDKADDFFVMADHKRLEQVCINLLSNAVKYNKPGGKINIVIGPVNDEMCRVSVKDTGIGMKKDFFDKVFLPFARDKEKATSIEGTGIGLVITKQLIEKMQGAIGFNSEYGVGTEFWVMMPMAKI